MNDAYSKRHETMINLFKSRKVIHNQQYVLDSYVTDGNRLAVSGFEYFFGIQLHFTQKFCLLVDM